MDSIQPRFGNSEEGSPCTKEAFPTLSNVQRYLMRDKSTSSVRFIALSLSFWGSDTSRRLKKPGKLKSMRGWAFWAGVCRGVDGRNVEVKFVLDLWESSGRKFVTKAGGERKVVMTD